MRVDEPRSHQTPRGVDAPARGRCGSGPADGHDAPAVDRHPAARDLAAVIVHRGDQTRVRHEHVDGPAPGATAGALIVALVRGKGNAGRQGSEKPLRDAAWGR